MPRKELTLPLATGSPIELHSESYLRDLIGTNWVGVATKSRSPENMRAMPILATLSKYMELPDRVSANVRSFGTRGLRQ